MPSRYYSIYLHSLVTAAAEIGNQKELQSEKRMGGVINAIAPIRINNLFALP
jgi:hypothetical protein